jgi:hypothetical protein
MFTAEELCNVKVKVKENYTNSPFVANARREKSEKNRSVTDCFRSSLFEKWQEDNFRKP